MRFSYILDEVTKYYLSNYGTINFDMENFNFDGYECSYCECSFRLDEINHEIKFYGLISSGKRYICCICNVCLNRTASYLVINISYDFDYIKENYRNIFKEFNKYELML